MTKSEVLREGMVLLPGNPARPAFYRSPRLHARQRHSGAPWHPDYVEETEALPGKRIPYAKKSEFFVAATIDEAITMAADLPAIVGAPPDGNLVVLVGFGREIGYDATRRRNTESATVVASQTGELITVFPGLP